jgi:pre-mRNA-splicing factor CWC26
MAEKKTASGHRAGVHSASSFGVAERALKRERDEELAAVNKAGTGGKGGKDQGNEETVYRDKRGKKLDMLNEFMKQQNSGEGQKQMVEEAQYEWGKGSVQKKQVEDAKQQLQDLASQPFARTVDDPALERARKGALRDGDPMAQYFAARRDDQKALQVHTVYHTYWL